MMESERNKIYARTITQMDQLGAEKNDIRIIVAAAAATGVTGSRGFSLSGSAQKSRKR